MLARQIEHTPRPRRARFKRFDWMSQVVNRAGKRCQMKNAIDLAADLYWLANVALDELDSSFSLEMGNVLPISRDQIVYRNDFMTCVE
jgi:hypothetical protein